MRYILMLILIVFVLGCQPVEEQPTDNDDTGMEDITGQYHLELEKTACSSADKGGTCDTKLVSLGFVTKEKCCETYGKCC